MSNEIKKIALIGAGKVGTALGYLLSRRGYQLTAVYSRSTASAKKSVHVIGQGNASDNIIATAQSAEIVFITTPDKAIEATCAEIAARQGFAPESIVIHCSGALPSSILEPARSCGAHIASLHPIQSFAEAKQAIKLLPGSYFGFEGDSETEETARQLVEALEGKWLAISTEDKPLYHVAAVFACNYVVTLLNIGVRLLEEIGVATQDALPALLPLLCGTVDNLKRLGLPQALTGPIARGDIKTVESHLQALGEKLPELVRLYSELGTHTLSIGQDKGTLPQATAEDLRKLIEQKEKKS